MLSIFKDTAITIEALKAADAETLTGAGVDMKGYESVIFIVGALKGEALDFSIKAQQDTESDFSSDPQDLEGTLVAFSTTIPADGLTSLEIHNPQERYVRTLVIVPDATAATPTFCLAIRFNAKVKPITNAGEIHSSPDEGTA